MSISGKSFSGLILLSFVVGALFLLAEAYSGVPAFRVSDSDGIEHRLTKHEPILDPRAENLPPVIFLELVVDLKGNVVSASPEAWMFTFPTTLRKAAIDLAKTWKYKPFLDPDGKAINAKFRESVSFLPPERRIAHAAPFPEINDLNSLRIRLRRTPCFGSCPDYTVEVRGDGSVVFNGKSHVAVPGEHRGRISQTDVERLLDSFHAAGYFSLEDHYASAVTDNPTYLISLTFDDVTKSVTDYVGARAGMPAGVEKLEEIIDQVSGTDKWITGTAETASSLEQEKFDFRAHPSLLSEVASGGSLAAVTNLIAAGAEVSGRDQMKETALVHAASRGEAEMVHLLLQAGAGLKDEDELGMALLLGASSGKLEVVKQLLSVGADPDYVDPYGRTVLMFAAGSGSPEVVAELLKLHPDVVAKDNDGETALMNVSRTHSFEDQQTERKRAKITAMLINAGADVNAKDNNGDAAVMQETFDAEVVRELIRHNADVNQRNKWGETALIRAVSPGVVRLLLQAGADTSVRDTNGISPLSHAKQYGLAENVTLIESAMAGSLHPK